MTTGGQPPGGDRPGSQNPGQPHRGGEGSRLRAVARNLGWMLASRGLSGVLSLIYLAVIARTLGVTDFGRFAIIVGAAQVLTALVGFQTWQIIVRYGAAHLAAGDEERLGRLYRVSALLDAGSAVVGIGLSAFILMQWGEALGVGETLRRAALIFTIVQLLSVRSTPLGILRLRDRFSLAAFADSTMPMARCAGALVVMLVHPTLQGFLVAWMVAELLTAAAFWTMAARTGDLRIARRKGAGLGAIFADNPGFGKFATSTNINATLMLSGKQIPLLLVGGMVGTAAAGQFRLAAQLANALTKLSQLITQAAFPEIVRSIDAGRLVALGRFLRRSVVAGSLIGGVVFVLVILAGGPVLRLMGGEQFAGAYPILLWLAAAACVDLVAVGFEPVLFAAGAAVRAFFVRLVATGVLFATAWLLAPEFGANGVASAVLLYSLSVAVLLGLALVRTVRRAPPTPAVGQRKRG